MANLDFNEVMEAAEEDNGMGFCLACGTESGHYCEPDLEGAECEDCGEHKVAGAMAVLLQLA